MQISDITQQYTGSAASAESLGGTKGLEHRASTLRNLTPGNIFEGTVTTVKGNQVTLGLANGNELSARIEADIKLVQGQSMFFQVKSNDGQAIAIRPYVVDGNGANLTLLNALKAANLPVTDKYLSLANSLVAEQMPIDKNTMGQLARTLMANPQMNVQTLVQMKKLNIPITTEMVAQFENYMDDKSAVHSALDRFIGELPKTLAGKGMPTEQLRVFDSQLLMLLAGERTGVPEAMGYTIPTQSLGGFGTENFVVAEQKGERTTGAAGENVMFSEGTGGAVTMAEAGTAGTEGTPAEAGTAGAGTAVEADTVKTAVMAETTAGERLVISEEIVQEPTLQQMNNQKTVEQQKTQALIQKLFGDIGITEADSPVTLLQKLAQHIQTGTNVIPTALETLFSSKDVQGLLRQVIEGQLFLDPKDVADTDKVKALYTKLTAKTHSIEQFLQSAGLKELPLAQTLGEIHANVDFMNQINQAYNYIQLPLRMTNQNASGQLYVYTSKRNISDPEQDLTAFLHLDLEHLGATDVSVRMHKREVSTKFYIDNDASYDLLQKHMPKLEERLRAKGYNCKIEVENEGCYVDFVDDFLKKDAPPTGQLHRYSFDVRA